MRFLRKIFCWQVHFDLSTSFARWQSRPTKITNNNFYKKVEFILVQNEINYLAALQMQRTTKKIIQHPNKKPTPTTTAIMIPISFTTVWLNWHWSSSNSYPNSQAQRPFKSFFHAHWPCKIGEWSISKY